MFVTLNFLEPSTSYLDSSFRPKILKAKNKFLRGLKGAAPESVTLESRTGLNKQINRVR